MSEPPSALSHRVNQAIDRGVTHLLWDWCQPKGYANHLGLLGLTLLECGVPRNDPAVRRMADLVRAQNLDATYELSLAILFLDRLGDRKDAGIIRTFARRLLKGQSASGSWGYHCWWRPGPQELCDNSNTQFAVLGLWVAQRHGVSVGEALGLTAGHFRKSQGGDGSWGYRPKTNWRRDSMTCAGLVCLAAQLRESPGYLRPIHPRVTILADDSTITRGLGFLGKSFDALAKGKASDSWCALYFLWSLERVAAIYGLETIGSQPWYPWTAERLVRTQQGDGSWSDLPAVAPVPTCFALLILRRSNLTPDLLVGVPCVTQPRKPTGDSWQPLVHKPSSAPVPAPGPELGAKPGAGRR